MNEKITMREIVVMTIVFGGCLAFILSAIFLEAHFAIPNLLLIQ